MNVTGLTVSLPQSVELTPQGAGGGEVRGVRVDPPTARINVEVLQTTLTRPIPLTPVVTGEPAGGFRISGVAAFPSTVQVRGTIDELQAIDAITLQPIDVTGARASVSRTVAADLPPGLSAPGLDTVTVLVTIGTVDGTLRLRLAPEATGVAEGFFAEFDDQDVDVTLAGPQPALNALTVAAVRVTADLADIGAGPFAVSSRVEVPSGITVTAVRPEVLSGTLVLDE